MLTFFRSRFYLASSLFLCLLLVVSPVAAKSTKKANKSAKSNKTVKANGWIFDIRSDRGGHQTLYISDRGVRFKYKTFTAVLKSPQFDATIFSTVTRKYTTIPYEVWRKRYGSRNRRVFQPVNKKGKVAGLNARVFQSPTHNRGELKEFWMTGDLKVPEQLTLFVSEILNVPPSSGLPLKILLLRRGQIPIVNWDVITCKRQVIGDDIFTVPKGFKKVSSEMELFMKEEESDGMADLLQ